MSKKTKVSFFGGIWSILANYVKRESTPSYHTLYAKTDYNIINCNVTDNDINAQTAYETLYVRMESVI